MNIYLDLESIPCQDAALCAIIAEGVKPPATMSKADTIAAWNLDKKPAAIEEAVLKTSLDGTFGMIAMIGFAIDDEAPTVLVQKAALEGKAWATAEAGVLALLNITIAEAMLRNPGQGGLVTFIGHNIIGFDLRFLWQRYVINGIKPFAGFPLGIRYSGDKVYDTMTEWQPARDKFISLDKLCKVLKVTTPKGNMSGADVWPKIQAGKA